MNKFFLLLLPISILIAFCSCSNKTQGGDYDHLEFFTGKIVEIKDENTVLIQITEERGGYKVDDKVYVHYDKAEVCLDSDTLKTLNSNYKPVIGDEFNIQSFPEQDYSKIDGYDYRESVGQITMYVSSDWSSQENS